MKKLLIPLLCFSISTPAVAHENRGIGGFVVGVIVGTVLSSTRSSRGDLEDRRMDYPQYDRPVYCTQYRIVDRYGYVTYEQRCYNR